MTKDQLTKMGNELVRLCNGIERHGLVDYQYGVWEERIVDSRSLKSVLPPSPNFESRYSFTGYSSTPQMPRRVREQSRRAPPSVFSPRVLIDRECIFPYVDLAGPPLLSLHRYAFFLSGTRKVVGCRAWAMRVRWRSTPSFRLVLFFFILIIFFLAPCIGIPSFFGGGEGDHWGLPGHVRGHSGE